LVGIRLKDLKLSDVQHGDVVCHAKDNPKPCGTFIAKVKFKFHEKYMGFTPIFFCRISFRRKDYYCKKFNFQEPERHGSANFLKQHVYDDTHGRNN